MLPSVCTAVVYQRDTMVDDSIANFVSQSTKFHAAGWTYGLYAPFIWNPDGSDKGTSHFVQILEKVQRRPWQ